MITKKQCVKAEENIFDGGKAGLPKEKEVGQVSKRENNSSLAEVWE